MYVYVSEGEDGQVPTLIRIHETKLLELAKLLSTMTDRTIDEMTLEW
jgi:hypothetical protein